jgi:lysyl-tRNA synthetase class 2
MDYIPFLKKLNDLMPTPEEISEIFSKLSYVFNPSIGASEVAKRYDELEGSRVSIAGRVIAIRKAGKLIFIDLLDQSGKIQCYFDFNLIGEAKFQEIKAFNVGDIMGVAGTVFKTKPGEISVNVAEAELLSKAVLPLPPRWYGIKDVELRYRKRYLDLIMDPEIRKVFITRGILVSSIRSILDSRGFLEFETPTIQPLYGGADAEPFKVKVNTLKEEHYLRISNELYLKKLIIGGFEKVYEIYKAFRNEDIDSTHSPEFTMVEWYQAYTDYNDMMKLTEEMLLAISQKLGRGKEITYQGKKISWAAPFKRVKYIEIINSKVGEDVMAMTDEELFALVEKKVSKIEKGKRNRAHAYDKLFSSFVQPLLIQPTFVIDFPKETSPLTRPKRGDERLVERFELFISGLEIANSYSELNDPVIQRNNFEAQMVRIKEGDKEAEPLDMDFIEAMEYGMPPTGGLGLGIDRLVMLFTDKASIKEVILFPMEKREK